MCPNLESLLLRCIPRCRNTLLRLCISAMCVEALGAQTNQVWVTEVDSVYVESNGVRRLDPARVAEAQKLPECRPTELDPAGNWGQVSEGLQLSLRLAKTNYATNEPVVATLITRNVTDADLWYLLGLPTTLEISVLRGGEKLARKDEPQGLTPFQQRMRQVVRNPHQRFIHPGTQRKEILQLSEMFDLSVPGDYSVSAKRGVPSLQDSHRGAGLVSGTAAFRVVGGKEPDR